MNKVLEVQKERIFSDFNPVCFPDPVLPPLLQEKSLKSSAFRPLEHGDLHSHLLFGVFWCLSSAHPHGAVRPDSALQPLPTGFLHVGRDRPDISRLLSSSVLFYRVGVKASPVYCEILRQSFHWH